jgi:hypothetical protein
MSPEGYHTFEDPYCYPGTTSTPQDFNRPSTRNVLQ